MKELVLQQEPDGTWLATCDRLPGFVARGRTEQEAIENIKRALSLYFPCGPCRSDTEE